MSYDYDNPITLPRRLDDAQLIARLDAARDIQVEELHNTITRLGVALAAALAGE